MIYLLIVGGGGGALGLCLLIPWFFYRFRKPSWKSSEATAELEETK